MKFKFFKEHRKFNGTRKKQKNEGLKELIGSDFSNIDQVIEQIIFLCREAEKNLKEFDYDCYQGNLGMVLTEIFADVLGWEFGYVGSDDPYADCVSVVSLKNEYYFNPSSILSESLPYKKKWRPELLLGFKNIVQSHLPPSLPDGFLELNDWFTNPELVMAASRRLINAGGHNETEFSDEVFLEFTGRWGFSLPADYLLFLQEPKLDRDRNSFDVVPGDWGSAWEQVYLLQDHEPALSLNLVFDWKRFPLKDYHLPIGADGSGGYLLMSFVPEEKGTIYYAANWSTLGASDGPQEIHHEMGYWKLAESFTEFMKMLKR